MKKHGHIGVSLFVLSRSIPFLLREDVWDVPRSLLLLASHLHVYSTSERPPRRSRLSQTVRFIATNIMACFGRPLSLHCAFHLRTLRSQSDINDDAKHISLYQSLSYAWGNDTIKIISVSGIGVWVCHTSHEVKTPWMSRSHIYGACESIASRSGARFVQGVRCPDWSTLRVYSSEIPKVFSTSDEMSIMQMRRTRVYGPPSCTS